ncbi:nitrilase/cyanide hydratase and apolipoprotein N-acyltransferase [Acetonema longum DSM 6540]|uniref:Nitrilase/cyanide hydratase and apolipoprotein N-acyltransferase n=1 Tax=Acetonema longum DSM 6540 TaxID=1009370 RepID=F7NPQ6_9FIRM|nr:carbon-nitrogen family hydrolase [Acetonema longum]EGO61897.1 nitrilase/cyanide hydratase and apolipoprotein N-acyltransferase [Acetonema longum DSM 6540]
MQIAMVQMEVVSGNIQANRERGIRMAEEAADKARTVVLPEIWTTGYGLKNVEQWAEDPEGPVIQEMRRIAKTKGVYIVAGSMPVKRDDRIFNETIVFDPQGQIVTTYQKVHMFSLYGEEKFFSPGNRRASFQLGEITAGLTICYDLRFPELYRSLALDGAQMIFVVAEWPRERLQHWITLNQARAIENQVYLCSVNCVGEHRGIRFPGHSLFIDPNGRITTEGTDAESIIYAQYDASMVPHSREGLTVWQDRKCGVYRME